MALENRKPRFQIPKIPNSKDSRNLASKIRADTIATIMTPFRCRSRLFWWLSCLLWLGSVHSFTQVHRYQDSRSNNAAERRIKTTRSHLSSSSAAAVQQVQYSYDPTLLLGKQAPPDATILSQDPLVYVVPNLLKDDECNSYIDRVQELAAVDDRPFLQSNPPDVSLDVNKLWPLPLISLGAGIPPLLKLQDSSVSANELAQAVLFSIAVAFGLSAVLVALAVPLIRLLSSTSLRTSNAMALNLKQDVDFVTPLVDRVAQVTQHPWHAWEAPVVTKYKPGAIFARHGDASPTRGSEWLEEGGQRVVTCICYLNTLAEGGGETYFDQLDIAVQPTRGSALVFFPANVDTLQADDRTTHESLPPIAEEKWIVQMFGRVGPRVPPPLGLPDAYKDKAN